MPRSGLTLSLMTVLFAGSAVQAHPLADRLKIDLEWGAAWQARNDVQSPNNAAGTRFALDSLTGRGPESAPRAELTWRLNPRDDLRLVAAPLRLEGLGNLPGTVNYEGRTFAAGATSATYRFDSYRATWRRSFSEGPDWVLKAGVTGKIRDAAITLVQQDGTSATRSDLGFVPLLHFHALRHLDERSRLVFDADGLASSRGRAFDLSLRYVHDLHGRVSGFAGVRVLDGGADNDSVYNFARFNYLTVGLSLKGF